MLAHAYTHTHIYACMYIRSLKHVQAQESSNIARPAATGMPVIVDGPQLLEQWMLLQLAHSTQRGTVHQQQQLASLWEPAGVGQDG